LRRREKLFWLCIGAILIVLFLSIIPSHYPICEVTEKSQEKDCPSYQFVPFIAIKVQQILDRMGGVLTALATIAIACFTLSLRQSTDKLWDAGERQLKLLSDTSAAQSRDMQASVTAARDSANAAMTAIGSERAWITFENFETASFGGGTMDGIDVAEGLLISIKWKNSGRSPALMAQIFIDKEWMEPGGVVPIFGPRSRGEQHNGPVGQDKIISSWPLGLNDTETARLRSRDVSLAIYSVAYYRDTFQPDIIRQSEFCGELVLSGERTEGGGIPRPYFTMSPRGEQNTVT
jgi:hypothetical protein